MDSVPDAQLAAAAGAGDRDALAEIYDRYSQRLYSLAVRLTGDREAAADIVHETFVTAAQRLGELRNPERLRAWLYAVVRHQVVDHARQARRLVSADGVDMPDEGAVDGFGQVRHRELRELLADSEGGLDGRDRLVLELAYREELSGAELAAALGVRENHAHQLLSRARQRLRTALGALLVARQGRQDCTELQQVLHGWDGQYSTVWRKRVARHVDGCARCTSLERAVLSPAALAAALPLLALPEGLRAQVLTGAGEGTPGTSIDAAPWSTDGFPPGGMRDLATLADEPPGSGSEGGDTNSGTDGGGDGGGGDGGGGDGGGGGTGAGATGGLGARRVNPAAAPAAGVVAAVAGVLAVVVVTALALTSSLPGGLAITESGKASRGGGRTALAPVPPAADQSTAATPEAGSPPTTAPEPGTSSPPPAAEPAAPGSVTPEPGDPGPRETGEGTAIAPDPSTASPLTGRVPELQLSPSAVTLPTSGQASAVVELTNTGTGPADWTARAPTGLSVDPASGELGPGQVVVLLISVPAGGPPPGRRAQVTVSAPGSAPVAVTVS